MDLKNKDKKPKVPKKVYRWLKLYYTIVDYTWMDPESDVCKKGILKSGWLPVRVYNYNHPKMKRMLRALAKKQAEIRKSGEVDLNRLRDTVFNI